MSLPGPSAVYHLYVIRTGDRDGMLRHLNAAGSARAFIIPCLCTCSRRTSRSGYKPRRLSRDRRARRREILSLPMFPQLQAQQQARVADEVLAFTSKLAGEKLQPHAVLQKAAEVAV